MGELERGFWDFWDFSCEYKSGAGISQMALTTAEKIEGCVCVCVGGGNREREGEREGGTETK